MPFSAGTDEHACAKLHPSLLAHTACLPANCCFRGMSPEEKAYLRGRLLQLIPQDDNQVSSFPPLSPLGVQVLTPPAGNNGLVNIAQQQEPGATLLEVVGAIQSQLGAGLVKAWSLDCAMKQKQMPVSSSLSLP